MKKIYSRHFEVINRLLARRYRFLLLSLVGMIIVPNFLLGQFYEDFVSFVLRSLVVFAGIHAIHESKKQLYWGLTIGLFVIMINLLGIFEDSAQINFYLSFIIYILFYCLVAYRLMLLIIKTERVNIGVLYAAVNVYLLIGIIGGFIFMLLESSNPGSLINLNIENLSSPSNFFYFSFITLSTLGYGDITPASQAAKSVSMILSTTGPLYLTILVALLVSRFESEHDK